MSIPSSYRDETLPFRARARDLVSQMTLEEKVSQMVDDAAAIERLHIPSYNWWNEALHGVAWAGVATVFPQAIGLAATFDETLLHTVGDIISTEGRAKFHEFQRQGDSDIYKGLTFWAPNVNIFRDPRWGRGQETYGEDPYLSGRLGVAFIQGMQGDDPRYLKTAACAKHFAVHSGPESERHRFDAAVSQKDLRETYLPAFHACVKDGRVAGVMGAYNRVNGEPCCGSQTLLKDILRGEWGFDGYITSDCWAIRDFNEGHGVTKDILESAALAVHNGCDINCGCAFSGLVQAYWKGLISEAEIDACVTNLMAIRMRLGMFDAPEHVPYTSIPYSENDSPAHRQAARKTAQESLVLLKNEGNLLPLDRGSIRSIAVIGPNADSREALTGNYAGTASEYVTVLQGIREAAGGRARVFYAQGCHLWKDRTSEQAHRNDRLAEAVAAARMADVVVMCLGLNAAEIEGEEGTCYAGGLGGDRADLNLPGLQDALLKAVCQVGKPVILVLMSGSPLAVTWADAHIPAIVQAWYPGSQGGRAVASLLFGEFSPCGKLPVTFYRTTRELPDFRDYSMENRTYRYMKNEALYPFGYGLSYSRFAYSGLSLRSRIEAGENLAVTATVCNCGKREACEVVELYIRDAQASVRVPKWQLAGFRRISLRPGERQKVAFVLTARQMALIDNDGNCVLEPGVFDIYVGGNQPDERSQKLTGTPMLHGSFEVGGAPLPMEY